VPASGGMPSGRREAHEADVSLVGMKWATAAAVAVLLVAPVPVLAGVLAYGIAVVHALPWVIRAS
jgi:hypothetical protein